MMPGAGKGRFAILPPKKQVLRFAQMAT